MDDPRTLFDLTGKTAIVTGASRGIGAAAARHLATLGAHVVLAARSAPAITRLADEITDAGGMATAVATVASPVTFSAVRAMSMIRSTGRMKPTMIATCSALTPKV